MQVPRPRRGARAVRTAGRSAYQSAVDVVLTGVAVLVPLVITVYVLRAAYNFLASAIDPFVSLLRYFDLIGAARSLGLFDPLLALGVAGGEAELVSRVLTVLALLGLIGAVGVVARNRYGEYLIDTFDAVLMSIPGVGAVYKSFRRMSDVVMESDASNFRDVKLVEFPYRDVYVLGFVTNDAPPTVADAAGESEMVTLFLPLAPNPFMGGHLTNIPADRVLDVDMTVEEGVRAIITSGIATPQGDGEVPDRPHLTTEHLPGVDSVEELLGEAREWERQVRGDDEEAER